MIPSLYWRIVETKGLGESILSSSCAQEPEFRIKMNKKGIVPHLITLQIPPSVVTLWTTKLMSLETWAADQQEKQNKTFLMSQINMIVFLIVMSYE